MVGIWLYDEDMIRDLVHCFGNDESIQFMNDTYSLIVGLWYDDLFFYYVPMEEDGEDEPHIQGITQKGVSSDPAAMGVYIRPFNKMMTKVAYSGESDVDVAFVTKCLLAIKDEAMLKQVNSALISEGNKDLCLKPKPPKWNKYKFQFASYEDWMKKILGTHSKK